MKPLIPAITLALSLLSGVAAGQDPQDKPKRWEVRASGIYEYLGGKRPTGGPGVAVAGHYALVASDRFVWTVGAGGRSFGWAGGWHWAAVMVSAETSARWLPAKWIAVGALVGLDYGQWPECTNWGLCVRFWGATPRLSALLSWEATSWGRVEIHAGARLTNTIIHPYAVGFQGGTTGTIRF